MWRWGPWQYRRVASADPNVDAAVAAFHALNLTPLTAMPDNRQVYRTYDDYNNDMQALATANPSLVSYKLAPNKTIEGRDVHYMEITNNVTAADGKPVFYLQGAIHGNESAAAEDSMEFAIDVVNQSKVNPGGQRAARPRAGGHRAAREPGRLRSPAFAAARELRLRDAAHAAADLPHVDVAGRRHEPQLSARLGLEHRRDASPSAAAARALSPRSRTR